MLHINYDRESLTVKTDSNHNTMYLVRKTGEPYQGKVGKDFYGRVAPTHTHGTGNLQEYTNSTHQIIDTITALFDRIVDPELLIRRVNIAACNLKHEDELSSVGAEQLNLFEDYGEGQMKKAAEKAAEEREKRIQNTMLSLQHRYGKNAVVKGMNLLEGATTIERNQLIGGHKADD